MRQAVGAAQIDEHPERADARDPARADFALVQLVQQPVLLLRPPFLHRGALRQNHAVAPTVDLDHLEAQRAPLVFPELRDGLLAVAGDAHDLAERHERVDALHVDQQTALVAARDAPVEDLARIVPTLQLVPALLAARAVDRQLERPALCLRIRHKHMHEVARLELLVVGRVERAHLLGQHRALGLRAHVDDQRRAAPVDDDAFDDVAALRIERLPALLGEQRLHGVARFVLCKGGRSLGRRRVGGYR